MKVDLSCPVELWEYALPSGEKDKFTFTFFNLGQKTISSIQITITSYDAQDTVLSRRVERPMALEAAGRKPFTIELANEDEAIDSLTLTIDKAWFEDGTEWRRQQDVRLVDYEPNELPPNRALEELRYVAGEDAVGFPSDQGTVWICICGRVNGAKEAKCRRCSREKAIVFSSYSEDAVGAVIASREAELEEKARMVREEASRQEFMRQDKKRRQRRARRTRTMIITVTLVIAVLSYLFVVLGLPELRYQTAMAALNARDYESARTGFVDLEDYRDAADMVIACDMQQATEYAGSGDIAKVDTAMNILAQLGSQPGASELMSEAKYQKAIIHMDNQAYAEASVLFGEMPAYKNADTLREEAEYALAKQAMEAEQYEEAALRFEALGAYLDAVALARECVYRPAVAAMAEENFDEAAALLETISGYKDARELRLESIYKAALKAHLAGDYEAAAERFALLGDYEDASDQVKQSIYMAANTARDTEKYETAIKLYNAVPGYLDADEQVLACTYKPAVAMMDEGRYEEAAALLATIPEYEDAAKRYNDCFYLPGVAAAEAGNYDEAIALFEQVSEYSDATKQMQQAQYKRAEQMQADGELIKSIAAFEALGDYSNAAARANGARYDMAQEAFDAQDYALAAERFEALGKYEDAATRVKECAYEIGMALLDARVYNEAYDTLSGIEGYTPAKEKAREAAYLLGEHLTAAGDLEGAATAFGNAGKYEDAAERRQDSIYQWATQLMADGEYQQAGDLFNSIAGYTDAKAKRDDSYDLWLAESKERAEALAEEDDLQGIVDLLSELDLDTVPKAYAELQTMYLDANLKIARQMIAEDRSLEAYPYLIEASGYRNADTLLDKNIYRILGTWESETGVEYAFYLNGTAFIDGKLQYFNMFTPYGISLGESNDPETMERLLSYSTATDKALQLREDLTDKVIRLKRVKSPEVSRTNDAEGSVVLSEEEQRLMSEPVVDVIEVDGDGSVTDKNTETEAPEEVEMPPLGGLG